MTTTTDKLTVLHLAGAGGPLTLTKIDNTLEAFQSKVQGIIQTVPGVGDLFAGADLYVNEEGMFKGMTLTMQVKHHNLLGPILFVGGVDDEGEATSLTDKQIEAIGKRLGMKPKVDPEAM